MNPVLTTYSLAGGEEHFCHISKASGKAALCWKYKYSFNNPYYI